MGITTNGTQFGTTGEEKIQARGTSVMWDMFEDMEGDDIVGRDGFLANGTSVIKGAKVTAGTGRVVIIKRGIHGVGWVLLSADEVGFAVVVSFEWCAKMKNN